MSEVQSLGAGLRAARLVQALGLPVALLAWCRHRMLGLHPDEIEIGTSPAGRVKSRHRVVGPSRKVEVRLAIPVAISAATARPCCARRRP